MAHIFRCSALSAALVICASAASAQSGRPERPYRGLFGGGVGDVGQILTVTGSAGAGFSNDLIAEVRGGTAARPGRSWQGGLGAASGSVNYSLQGNRVTLSAAGATAARFYPSLVRDFVRGSQVRTSLSLALLPSTSLSAGMSAAHQPHWLGGVVPIEAETEDQPLNNLDFAAGLESYATYSGSIGLAHRRQLSKRTSLAASYGYRKAVVPGRQRAFDRQNAGGVLTRAVAQGLHLRGGYSYAHADYGSGRTSGVHLIDAGVDYSKPLSISRRTTVSFATGSSAIRQRGQVRFRLNGSANLRHELGRTWTASAAYSRRVALHDAWDDPVLSDGVSLGVNGLISRRLQFTARASSALGGIGTEENAPIFRTVHGSAALAYAATRFVNFSMTYSYYQHRFGDGALPTLGSPRTLDRQSVRATVSLWAPVFQRARRINASR